ncbi:MAG TPA: phosphotransferase, partial [Chloroflexota bacterium]
TYMVQTSSGRYVLRVYRAGWRSGDDVRYEIDVLRHLERLGVPVAAAIARRDASYLHILPAPEGPRHVVLFSYAPGKDDGGGEDHRLRYGRAVARIHSATDGFLSRHRRFPIDLNELLDKPLAVIEPLLYRRADDWQYLLALAEKLRRQVTSLPMAELDWGFCHGDFHGGNAHVEGDTLTFFDFDCCGPGWRAYDIGVHLWSSGLDYRATMEERWRQFLQGYREVRPLNDVDLAATPLFAAIRQIWYMGLHAGNHRDWGYIRLNDRWFDWCLKFLRDWERDRLTS